MREKEKERDDNVEKNTEDSGRRAIIHLLHVHFYPRVTVYWHVFVKKRGVHRAARRDGGCGNGSEKRLSTINFFNPTNLL